MIDRDEILCFLKNFAIENQEKYSIKRLGIFGSVARGEAKDVSDIDVVVDFEKPDLFNQVGIKLELEEKFATKVDVIALWKHMNPKLKNRIERDAIYV